MWAWRVGHASAFLSTAAYLPVDVCVLAALGAFHRNAPSLRRRPWLVAALVGVGLVHLLWWWPGGFGYWLDVPGIWCLLAVGAGLAHLLRSRFVGTDAYPERTLALRLLCAAVLALRLWTTLSLGLQLSPVWLRSVVVTAGLGEAVAVLVVGLVLLLKTTVAMRRLPAVFYRALAAGSAADPRGR